MTILSQPAGRTVAPRSAPAPAVRRLRSVAAAMALVVLAFTQRQGLVAPDTKLDLTVDPVGFMSRALHLWEPLGYFGQLQNQSYGYLFPMGPFFAFGHLIGLPAWVTQRLWLSVLLVVAFAGFERLATRLEIGTPAARMLAALAFAVAPRVVSVIGTISVEALPFALAPWVLVPLVGSAAVASPRRAAARSGLAILCVGGVNAAASIAVLPLPALWLLTRRGPRRGALLGWWVVCVVAATFWWVVPLLTLGRYSPPFLDYIENAAVTTGLTALVEVLRGTSHWLAYLVLPDGPAWPAGYRLVHDPVTIIDTVVVATLGLVGLSLRRMPHRRFLVAGVLFGTFLVTFGHTGSFTGWFAGSERSLLDGPLAALRNVHKYDVVLRLPLMLGLCHALGAASRLPTRSLNLSVRGLAVVGLLGCASPFLLGTVVPSTSYTSLPGYWRDAAGWLAAHADGGRALLVPAASKGIYIWGTSADEPLQALARSPWAVRDSIPLAPPGNIRFLDEVERRLTDGEGSAGLAPYLARAGVRFLVVRNDLDWARTGAPRPVVVHQALHDSPGIERVASFGPAVGPGPDTARSVLDARLDVAFPAVEIFQVADAPGPVQSLPVSSTYVVSGGPESLLPLADSGLLTSQPVVLAGDADHATIARGSSVLTDGLRRREVDFGRVRDNTSATLTTDDPLRMRRRVRDFFPFPPAGHETVARVDGAARVWASSSGSDVDALVERSPAHQPFSAFDGLPSTVWTSGRVGAVGAWIEVDFSAPVDVDEITVLPLVDERAGPAVDQVQVRTDAGATTEPLRPAEEPQRLAVRPGTTRRLRITAVHVEGGGRGLAFGLREVTVPGVRVSRPLVLPSDQAGATTPALVDVSVADGWRPACPRAGERPLCTSFLERSGEEDSLLDRRFDLPVPSAYSVSGRVRPVGGPGIDRFLVPLGPSIRATASSRLTHDPQDRPQAAVDRDLGSAWIAAADDANPEIRLTWPGVRTLDRLQILEDPALAASHPAAVRISSPAGLREVDLDREGYAVFSPLRTDRITLTFPKLTSVVSLNPVSGGVTTLPVGISELRFPGLDDLRRGLVLDQPAGVPCGFGPSLFIDGRRLTTSVTGTVGDLLRRLPMRLEVCGETGSVELGAGSHRLTLGATVEMDPLSVLLRPETFAVPPAGSDRITKVVTWGAESRTINVGPSEAATYLVVHENANPGWRAILDGRRLRAVRLDGWQQAWIVPPGAGGLVHLRFTPGRAYRTGLLAGLFLAVGLGLLALVRARPRAGAALRETRSVLVWGGFAVVAMGLVGGWAGVVALVIAWLVGVPPGKWGRERTRLLQVVVAGAYVAAGLYVVRAPAGVLRAPGLLRPAAQALCLVSLAALCAVSLAGSWVRRERAQEEATSTASPDARGRTQRRLRRRRSPPAS